MSARQPRDTDKTRIHVLIEDKHLTIVNRAAKKLRLARSNFMARAAYAAAQAEMAKGKEK